MGLLTRIFRNGREQGDSSRFHESESTNSEGDGSRNAQRRELVQVVMRDTMRKHGIPTDWMECRILSAVNRAGRPGLHVNFVVKQAHGQMLTYVFAFQESFEVELTRFEARARDWLMSIGWEFIGDNLAAASVQGGATGFKAATEAGVAAAAASERPLVSDRFDRDLSFAPTDDQMAREMPRTDEEVQRDLQALFAIRDAAIAAAARKEAEQPPPDFESTRPFDDDEKPRPRD